VIEAPFLAPDEAEAVDAAQEALQGAALLLPYLRPLASIVRVAPETRTASAAVFASGRLVVNPAWFLALSASDRLFVAAHQLLHLALRDHERCRGAEARLQNIAADYAINDMLRDALALDVPAGGLDCPGMASFPLDKLVAALRARHARGEVLADEAWSEAPTAPEMSASGPLDLLDTLTERLWFPEQETADRSRQAAAIEEAARRAVELGVLRERMDHSEIAPSVAISEAETVLQRALDSRFGRDWKWALQHWLEEAAPASRGFTRRSRRQGERADAVLRGRGHAGWILDLVLDTTGPIDRFMSALQEIGPAAGIEAVRLRHCRSASGADLVALDELGYAAPRGRGPVWPLLCRLGADSEVGAALVISDGEDDPAAEAMPFPVLWIFTSDAPA